MALLAMGGQFAYFDVLFWKVLGLAPLGQGGLHPALLSSVVSSAVVTFVAGGVAVAAVMGARRHPAAFPLAVALTGWAYLLAYSGLTILLAPDPASPLRAPFVIHFLVVEALASAALLRFTAAFPAPLDPDALMKPSVLPVGIGTLQHLRRWLLRPAAPWIAAAAAVLLVLTVNRALGRPVEDAAVLLLTDCFRLGTLILVVLNLRRGFLVADTAGRRSMFWFVVGFTLLLGAVGTLLGGNILTAVTGWDLENFNWRPVVLDLGVVGLIWGAAMAVLYLGPMKPGRVARRVAVIASYVTVGLFLAAGLESVLAGTVASRISLPEGVGTLVSFLTMILLYVSTRRPLEGMIYHAWAEGAQRGR